MTTLSHAIGRAAVIKAAITTAERKLQEAIDLASEAGLPEISDRLSASLRHFEHGHARAGEAAVMVAGHYGVPTSDVGGEDKPTDPPGGR